MVKRTITGAAITLITYFAVAYSHIPVVILCATGLLSALAVYEIYAAAGMTENLILLLGSVAVSMILAILPMPNYSMILTILFPIAVNSAISSSDDPMDDAQKLQRQIQQIMKKKEATIDAFLSGALTKEELQHMKKLYDERLAPLNERLLACKKAKKPTQAQIQSDLQKQIKSIVTCRRVADPFYKALLEKVVIQKDGTFQVRLNNIPQVWHFELQYHKTSQEEK